MGNTHSVPEVTAALLPKREAAGGPGKTTATASDGVSQTGAEGETGATESQQPSTDSKNPQKPNVSSTEPVIDQAGLDSGLWREVLPDPPIRESRLTPEEKTKFRGHIDYIFGEDALLGKRLKFDPDDVIEVVRKVIPYLKSESMLIEDVPFGVVIVADLHGQLHDLYRIMEDDAKDGKPGWENMKYLFLGDYVDRGRQALEVVMALFCLKMLYPDRIFLLRGNHEFMMANCRYGFPLEFHERYADEETAKLTYGLTNYAFCYLSVAAIVGNIYYCAHGGISPAGYNRRIMRRLKKPYLYSQDDVVAHDSMWSDPAKGLHGTTYNNGRGTSIHFGFDELAYALDNMECVGLFRGHTMIRVGAEKIGGLGYTLFSCVGQQGNKGAVAHVDENGKVTIRTLEIDEARVKWDAALLRMDGGVPNYIDEKTQFNAVTDGSEVPVETGELMTIH